MIKKITLIIQQNRSVESVLGQQLRDPPGSFSTNIQVSAFCSQVCCFMVASWLLQFYHHIFLLSSSEACSYGVRVAKQLSFLF